MTHSVSSPIKSMYSMDICQGGTTRHPWTIKSPTSFRAAYTAGRSPCQHNSGNNSCGECSWHLQLDSALSFGSRSLSELRASFLIFWFIAARGVQCNRTTPGSQACFGSSYFWTCFEGGLTSLRSLKSQQERTRSEGNSCRLNHGSGL